MKDRILELRLVEWWFRATIAQKIASICVILFFAFTLFVLFVHQVAPDQPISQMLDAAVDPNITVSDVLAASSVEVDSVTNENTSVTSVSTIIDLDEFATNDEDAHGVSNAGSKEVDSSYDYATSSTGGHYEAPQAEVSSDALEMVEFDYNSANIVDMTVE